MTQGGKLPVSSAPYLKDDYYIKTTMRDVMIALIPVSLVSIYFYGANAIALIAICIATAAVTEVIFRKLMRKKPTLYDGSALLTGLFVALLYQPTASWFSAMLATIIGVGIAKEFSGGLGLNRFNPALFGRVAMILLAPVLGWFTPGYLSFGTIDAVTQATPLPLLGSGLDMPGYAEMFISFQGGALSESSPLALLIGAAYLWYRKHIKLRIPIAIFATVAVFALLTGEDPIYHLLSGGLMIGALFMATDWVTAPITYSGKVIFGVSIGLLVMIFRVFLPPTEGVAFSILIMNAFVPVIDKATRHLAFLEPKEV